MFSINSKVNMQFLSKTNTCINIIVRSSNWQTTESNILYMFSVNCLCLLKVYTQLLQLDYLQYFPAVFEALTTHLICHKHTSPSWFLKTRPSQRTSTPLQKMQEAYSSDLSTHQLLQHACIDDHYQPRTGANTTITENRSLQPISHLSTL